LTSRPLTRRQRLARTSTVAVALLLSGVVGTALLSHTAAPQTLPTQHVSASLSARPVSASAGTSAGTALDPAMFAAGSCVEFAPTRGNRHLTVFLDAGHGGPDPGGQGVTLTGASIDEAQLTLPVVLDATALLRAQGFQVVDSRTTASSVVRLSPSDLSGSVFSLSGLHREVAARAVCANLAHASALVSVHFNVGASSADAGTLTTYDAVRPFAARSRALATAVHTALVTALSTVPGWHVPDDGIVTDDQVGNSLTAQGAAYGHLLLLGPASAGFFSTPSTMPGTLTEPLFLTDPFEGSVADSARGQHVIAAAIAQAIASFLG
jgi:N-acetylmuramoyl-L-alanine amidase